MPHAGFSIKLHSDPRVLEVGKAAFGLYAMSVSYCADFTTDGNIPVMWADAWGTKTERQKLVDAGLWQQIDSGYCIPDYHEYNLSREQVEEVSEAARKKAEARWKKKP